MTQDRKRVLSTVLVFILCAGLLAGCGETKAPESITIFSEDSEITSVDIMNGSELSGLKAVITPSDYTGEVTWESEDSGIAKVTVTDGEATITAKKTGSTKITASCDGVSVSVRVHVRKNQQNLSSLDTALTVNGVAYSSEKAGIYYADTYYSFIDTYGAYAAYYGLDTSKGLKDLKNQSCDYSSDGTWYGYFAEQSATRIAQIQALCDWAAENGIEPGEKEIQDIDDAISALDAKADELGYAAAEEYLCTRYGDGVTMEMYREFLENSSLADKAYTYYTDSLTYTDEEIQQHFEQMGYEGEQYEYPTAVMRHILIMAQADENGEYTEEAIAEAHEKAENVYEEWKNGEMTEESFGELADEYSDDGGSNTAGGYYEDVYKGEMVDGIDSWIFEEDRQPGDTAVIDNNGSYTGTHIVYFVSYGELYKTAISVSDLKNTDISSWFEELITDYTVVRGADYSSIGK